MAAEPMELLAPVLRETAKMVAGLEEQAAYKVDLVESVLVASLVATKLASTVYTIPKVGHVAAISQPE